METYILLSILAGYLIGVRLDIKWLVIACCAVGIAVIALFQFTTIFEKGLEGLIFLSYVIYATAAMICGAVIQWARKVNPSIKDSTNLLVKVFLPKPR